MAELVSINMDDTEYTHVMNDFLQPIFLLKNKGSFITWDMFLNMSKFTLFLGLILP